MRKRTSTDSKARKAFTLVYGSHGNGSQFLITRGCVGKGIYYMVEGTAAANHHTLLGVVFVSMTGIEGWESARALPRLNKQFGRIGDARAHIERVRRIVKMVMRRA